MTRLVTEQFSEAAGGPVGGDPRAGSYFYRRCPDGTAGVVWAPNDGAAAGGAPAGVPVVTPAQLALEARDQLPLTAPTVHRSPDETGDYEGSPFTWVHLWTYFWTEPADFRSLTQTVSVGAVSATVIATPVALVFEPGDGGEAVTCAGPGSAWTEADGNDAPASGCGYQYRRVTEGEVDSQLSISWQVTWTGTGATGGALPAMQTSTLAPLRVLQVQVVNK